MLTILVIMNLNEKQKAILETAGEGNRFIFESDRNLAGSYVSEADIIIGNPPATSINGSPKLKLLQLQSAGTDGYTAPGILSENTVLTNATGAYDQSVAEHALALTLMLQKKFHLYRNAQERHEWKDRGAVGSIASSVVLILGFGSIGICYAQMVKSLGATVIGIKRRPSVKQGCADELYTVEKTDSVLPRADIIFSILPNTKETEHFFTLDRFRKMKKNAVFINCGRGNAVDTEVLYEVLSNGIIAAAACDVFEEEPLPAGSPLWSLENLMITPHTAGGDHLAGTKDKIIAIAAHNIQAVLGKTEYQNIIDFQTGYRK